MNQLQTIDSAPWWTRLARCRRGLRVAAIALVLANTMAAADAGWRDFFHSDDKDAATMDEQAESQLLLNDPLASEPVGEESADKNWMVTSPFGHVSWPEIKLPKFEFRSPLKSSEDGKPGWLAAPLVKARTMSQNAAHRTRTAWNSTVDRMKFALPGGVDNSVDANPQIAEDKEPGFWRRLLSPGSSESPSDEANRMAQQPTNPTR